MLIAVFYCVQRCCWRGHVRGAPCFVVRAPVFSTPHLDFLAVQPSLWLDHTALVQPPSQESIRTAICHVTMHLPLPGSTSLGQDMPSTKAARSMLGDNLQDTTAEISFPTPPRAVSERTSGQPSPTSLVSGWVAEVDGPVPGSLLGLAKTTNTLSRQEPPHFTNTCDPKASNRAHRCGWWPRVPRH
jgi:hypothetical protein